MLSIVIVDLGMITPHFIVKFLKLNNLTVYITIVWIIVNASKWSVEQEN